VITPQTRSGTGANWRINAKILSSCRGGESYRGGRPPAACLLVH